MYCALNTHTSDTCFIAGSLGAVVCLLTCLSHNGHGREVCIPAAGWHLGERDWSVGWQAVITGQTRNP